MLQLRDIHKEYPMGEGVVHALRGVTLDFRDSEFVAVLGPSGCGKTTLLNIVGGLDSYTSGNLIVNGTSTKEFKDAQWDAYRNHDVGFVFQSYNLIPHQSVLANVELALKLSRELSAEERKAKAMDALERVGLTDQASKKPTMLSGGQMQRVAIARALVNDPAIILADEPTGALDSDTSLQVMDILREVAQDRLVIMVTHNPDLAEKYATRIVRLKDGRVTSDSRPLTADELAGEETGELPRRTRLHMSTALGLSLQNLLTKKGRTFLTAFAGAIGIIGIALILSISNGVDSYIDDLQRSTMTSYPITIEEQSMDLTSVLAAGRNNTDSQRTEADHDLDAVYADSSDLEMAASTSMSVTENNLTAFKEYLDDATSPIHDYLGENGIVYSYDTKFDVYAYDPEGTFVDTDGSTLEDASGVSTSSGMSMASMMGGSSSGNENFEELLPGQNDELVSSAVTESYDLLYGSWPQAYDEVVLVLDANNEVSTTALYELGLLPVSQYADLMEQVEDGEDVSWDAQPFSYEDACSQELYLIPACDTYVDDGDGTFSDVSGDDAVLESLAEDAVTLKIVGVIRPSEDASYSSVSGPIGYTKALTDWLIDHTDESAVVKAQEASPDVNVLNGLAFSPADDEQKAADAEAYLESLGVSEKASLCREILASDTVMSDNAEMATQMLDLSEEELAATLDQALAEGLDQDVLLMIYDSYVSAGSYDENMEAFGVVSLDAPSSISLYADSFEDKDAIEDCIASYNESADEDDQISYTDYVGLLTSSVTQIVNTISYVLIAFVAISLVVSSIMIAIITYISVLERTKEIGVLRALGASKGDVSKIFNAETLIEGLLSGVLGVVVAMLLDVPITNLVQGMTGVSVTMALPAFAALVLVAISVVITLVAGFIPSRIASKKDPAVALRSE